jgi:hypothetical protein
MRKQYYITSFILFAFFLSAKSQNEIDALRYSWIGIGGTARYQSLGGAMGAVGGDPSCMASNPAGLARYTKSDFTLSIAHANISSNVVYNGTTAYNGKGNLGLNNLALIGAYKNDESNEWKAVQFGIGYHKLANFNNSIYINGIGDNSLLDQFAGDAAGIDPASLGNELTYTSSLAYQTYLIDPDPTSSNNEYTTQMDTSRTYQSRTINKIGRYGETNISISGNYLDKVYLGMSIGFPMVRYNEEYLHHEEPVDTNLSLQEFDYTSSLTTRGNGINLKLGAIFTPTDWLRLGISLHTPSSIGLSDEWYNGMHSEFNGGISYDTTTATGTYNYRLRTPGRITGSAAFIFTKWGLISVDYEMVNYGRAKYKADNSPLSSYPFTTENLTIKTIYGSVSNIRIGGEFRYELFTLRGGYSIYGDPFKAGTTTVDATKKTISAGLGFRMKGFYADLCWSQTKWNEAYFMYDPLLVNTANIGTRFTQIVVTTGFRF